MVELLELDPGRRRAGRDRRWPGWLSGGGECREWWREGEAGDGLCRSELGTVAEGPVHALKVSGSEVTVFTTQLRRHSDAATCKIQ